MIMLKVMLLAGQQHKKQKVPLFILKRVALCDV